MSGPAFTPAYILMAKASDEIQKMAMGVRWCEAHGKALYFHDEIGESICEFDTTEPWWNNKGWHKQEGSGFIWLPRLDQLLGMLGGPSTFVHAVAHAGDGPGIYFDYEAEERGDWHEVALAVVMREKYGKKWTGKDWVTA